MDVMAFKGFQQDSITCPVSQDVDTCDQSFEPVAALAAGTSRHQ
jgi:hypothetical protein